MIFNKYIDRANGKTDYDALKTSSNMMAPGSKWRGERSDTLGAIQDRDMLTLHQASRDTKYGGISGVPGRYRFSIKADDGSDVADQPLPFQINGEKRMMYPGTGGIFTVHDGKLLREEQKYYEERQHYLNKMVKLCLASDEQCAKLLGLPTKTALVDALGNGKGKKIIFNGGEILTDLPEETKSANGMPSILSEIAVDSLAFSWGISKLKAVIGHVNPIVEDDVTPDSVNPNDQVNSA